MMIKAPAAMARAAIAVWSPEKLKLSSGIRPVRISQTASSSIPMFLVIFIDVLLWSSSVAGFGGLNKVQGSGVPPGGTPAMFHPKFRLLCDSF
jgi:hypothetical protein